MQPYSPPSQLTGNITFPNTSLPRETQTQPVSSSSVDATQISWDGFKRSIAASGEPTTPLGKFFDWLLGIKNYPKRDATASEFVETSQSASTTYLRYILDNDKAVEYQKTLWAISVIYDRSSHTDLEPAITADCIIGQLNDISSGCEKNLSPKTSGHDVAQECSDDHPSVIIPSDCLIDSEDDAPSYTQIAPGYFLHHRISWGNTSSSLETTNTEHDASFNLFHNQWDLKPVGFSDTCSQRLDDTLHRHVWRHLAPCFPGNNETFLAYPETELYPKAARFPSTIVTPFICNSNPDPDEANIYSAAVFNQEGLQSYLYAQQWTIRVLPTSIIHRSLQQCIINTLNGYTKICYEDMWPSYDDSLWFKNCTSEINFVYPTLWGDTFDFGDFSTAQSISTPLFDEIILEHKIAGALSTGPDNLSPPYYWPHSMTHETGIRDPRLPQKIWDAFQQNLLCSIEHCYPQQSQIRERFKQCVVVSKPDISSVEYSVKKKIAIVIAGGFIVLYFALKWIDRRDEERKKHRSLSVVEL